MTSLLGETYHINSTLRKGILLLLFMFVMCVVNAQEFATDSLTQKVDSTQVLPTDSVSVSSPKNKKKSALDDVVKYKANDSIVMYSSGSVYLYGEAEVHYQNITLTSDYIRVNMDSSQVYASGVLDTLGDMQGKPVFSDGPDKYSSSAMSYNFKTKKAFIWDAVTEQQEGYVTSEKTKKMTDDEFCLKGGRYTTCDQHDHPHFYLKLTKAKMKTGKYVVTGPAYMVFEDVPLPLAIPFGYFPFSKKYQSGLLMPTFGLENNRGFYMRGLGYYWAINDYVDLALRTDIYTKGSWALNLASRYVVRYKFSGSLSLSYMDNRYGEKGLADYTKSRDFKVSWSHSQNRLSSPYTVFSAGVNFSTSSYERNNLDSYYNPDLLSQNTKSSSISLSQSFPKAPINISVGANLYQRTSDSTISLSLPNVTFSLNKIYPFKFKNRVGKEKWYERFGFNYTMRFENSVEVKENLLFKSPYRETWNYAFDHSIPMSFPITFLKYFTLTPSFSYHERWYFKRYDQSWNEELNQVQKDTIYGFNRVYDFTTSVSLSTKFYGFYKPVKFLFGDKIEMIRHVITPTISFSYHPDFGKEKFKVWDSYERPASDGTMVKQYYSHYAGMKYGAPSQGIAGVLNMRLDNNIEMKVAPSKKDTTSQSKKISLIDNYSVSTSYNIFADSLKWSNINMSLRLKLFKDLSLNVQASFDPYTYAYNEFKSLRRVNVSYYSVTKKVARLTSLSTSFSYTISNQTFKKKKKSTDEPQEPEKKYLTANSNREYQSFSMPWSLSASYNLRYSNSGDYIEEVKSYDRKLSHDLRLDGRISFTPKWNFSMSMSYDITNNKITYTSCQISRDLHCWQMSLGFVPFGLYRSYNFYIGVKASMLRDLKLEKRSDTADNYIWR